MRTNLAAWRRAEGRAPRRASALVASLLGVTFLSATVAALFCCSLAQRRGVVSVSNEIRALYVAEAGVSESVYRITTSAKADVPTPSGLGASEAPVQAFGGCYWTEIVGSGDGSFTITSWGRSSWTTRTVQAVAQPRPGGDGYRIAFWREVPPD